MSKSLESHREVVFSNDKVNIWQVIIHPGSVLGMHSHPYDRVFISLNSGKLQLTTDKNEVSHLELEKGKAHYLPKFLDHELHMSENISSDSIRIIVIDLKKD